MKTNGLRLSPVKNRTEIYYGIVIINKTTNKHRSYMNHTQHCKLLGISCFCIYNKISNKYTFKSTLTNTHCKVFKLKFKIFINTYFKDI